MHARAAGTCRHPAIVHPEGRPGDPRRISESPIPDSRGTQPPGRARGISHVTFVEDEPEMTAAAAPVILTSGDSPVRHALRRLWGYIRANGWYYVGCTVLTLAYAGTFVAVPRLLGWAVTGAFEGLSRDQILVPFVMATGSVGS